jgi:hypothetical protein
MKKVVFLFFLVFALAFTVGNAQPESYVKEKTEQSAAIATVTTHSLL